MAKIIRYANQGFKDYLYLSENYNCPKFIDWENNKEISMVAGCYVFVEEEDLNALTGYADKRYYEQRHEIVIPDETLIWVNNVKWCVKGNGKMGFHKLYREMKDSYLSWNSWVQVRAEEVAQIVKEIKRKTGEVQWNWCEAIYTSGEYAVEDVY